MKQVQVKICGITLQEQAIAISHLGVDALGFILYPKSPRYLAPEKIREIVKSLPPFIKTVGVFVNETAADMSDLVRASGVDLAQLSGDEPPETCRQLTELGINWIKALRVKEAADIKRVKEYPGSHFLLDAWSDDEYGGTGKTFDWGILEEMPERSGIVLAGGLNADNVQQAIRDVQPYGLDISSGVEESPGIKAIDKVQLLMKRISAVSG